MMLILAIVGVALLWLMMICLIGAAIGEVFTSTKKGSYDNNRRRGEKTG